MITKSVNPLLCTLPSYFDKKGKLVTYVKGLHAGEACEPRAIASKWSFRQYLSRNICDHVENSGAPKTSSKLALHGKHCSIRRERKSVALFRIPFNKKVQFRHLLTRLTFLQQSWQHLSVETPNYVSISSISASATQVRQFLVMSHHTEVNTPLDYLFLLSLFKFWDF